jgi:tRNA(Ile)-lysidine synthase
MVRTAPGGAVVWVAGVRADDRFKCTAATRVAYLLRVVDAD